MPCRRVGFDPTVTEHHCVEGARLGVEIDVGQRAGFAPAVAEDAATERLVASQPVEVM
jgi:hypothetical protein